MPDSTALNIGLIGVGRIGRLHAANLAHQIPRARLVAIADVIEEAARQSASEHDVPVVVADYRKLLDDADIQAVVICSATDTHAQIIEEAAQAGKHIFCEKPIDLTLERIDTALAAVERGGVVFQIGLNRRFDANFRRVRQAVQQAEIGRPWQLHIVSRDPAPPPEPEPREIAPTNLTAQLHYRAPANPPSNSAVRPRPFTIAAYCALV